MVMRTLNTQPGQDDQEKLASSNKQVEELQDTVDSLRNELTEKTNRIEELCRLANDFKDDSERLKTEVSFILEFFLFHYYSHLGDWLTHSIY